MSIHPDYVYTICHNACTPEMGFCYSDHCCDNGPVCVHLFEHLYLARYTHHGVCIGNNSVIDHISRNQGNYLLDQLFLVFIYSSLWHLDISNRPTDCFLSVGYCTPPPKKMSSNYSEYSTWPWSRLYPGVIWGVEYLLPVATGITLWQME